MKDKLFEIAKKHISELRKREDFRSQGLDELDFFDVPVWAIENLVEEIYRQGFADRLCIKDSILKTTNLTVKEFLEPFGNDYCIDICVIDNETGKHHLPSLSLDEILGNKDYVLKYGEELGNLKVQKYCAKSNGSCREMLVAVDLVRNMEQANKFYEC